MISKFLRNSSFLSTIIGSSLLIIILAVTGFDVLPILNIFGGYGSRISKYIMDNDLKHTVNSTILIALSNFIIYLLFSFPKIEIVLRNSNLKSDSTELPLATSISHVPKIFYLHINLDYSNKLGYLLCKWLGGINIELSYPSWIDLTVDDRFWNTTQFTDNNTLGLFIVNIFDALPESKLDKYLGETFTRINLITNLTINAYDECFIDVAIKPKSNNIICRFVLIYIIKLFYDVSYKPHKIKTNQ
ncbi:hypothetical protein [Clostridioides sp. ZZV14-6387]|uniref:hypothetical protein n=1 Tax=Clostridioides sp. ZZV14-6387 TaxID=2811497 RepID=UPI001D113FB2|nr:hypothetical protein [Clostridioides sp. ZZV14-6387]